MNLPNRVFCPSCKEIVFSSNIPLKLKNITFERLFDGTRRWYARDFQMTVHQCHVDIAELIKVTVIDTEDSA